MSHAVSARIPGRIFSILTFLVTVFVWRWAARQSDPIWLAPVIALGIPLLIFPVVWIGSASLNRDPNSAHADLASFISSPWCVIGSALICAAVASDKTAMG